MFKFAALIRADGASVNPFVCSRLRSYLRGEVVVMTRSMFDSMAEGMRHYGGDKLSIVIIGEGPSIPGVYIAPDIQTCIKHLSLIHQNKSWWIIGDNSMANDFIWKGLIMDVYLSEVSDQPKTQNWMLYDRYVIPQTDRFNKTLLDSTEVGFSVVSCASDGFKNTKMIKHFMRRNVEEARLLLTMNEIMVHGNPRPNRTGVDTKSLFGKHFEYRLTERINPRTGKSSFRIPLLTTKRVFHKSVILELLWFMRGQTNSKLLEDQGVNIWKGNTSRSFLDSIGLDYPEGEGGPIYGFQWRHASAIWDKDKLDYSGEGIDQVANVIKSLQEDPFGRRHIINAWNVSDLSKMCLPPCHVLYIFYVHEENGQKYLSLSLSQRSGDFFLGIPFNAGSGSLLLMMMAHRVGMKPHTFIHDIADAHVYESHFEATSKQIRREPCMFPYASIGCDPLTNLEDYQLTDFQIDDYYHHNRITAPMAA
jgi:thymidylate synthase